MGAPLVEYFPSLPKDVVLGPNELFCQHIVFPVKSSAVTGLDDAAETEAPQTRSADKPTVPNLYILTSQQPF